MTDYVKDEVAGNLVDRLLVSKHAVRGGLALMNRPAGHQEEIPDSG